MEGLFPILLFIIVIALVNKNAKKKSQAAVKAHRTSGSTPQSTAIRAAASALPHVPNVLDMIDKAAEDDPEETEGAPFANGEGFSDAEGCIGGSLPHAHESSFTDEAGCIGGSIPHIHEESFTDEAGCIGGSLPHGHEEGSLERVTAAAEEEPAAPAYQPRTWNAGDLRRAVIMNEVLRAPVALRGKGDRR